MIYTPNFYEISGSGETGYAAEPFEKSVVKDLIRNFVIGL